jgi:hypothetical protein
MSDIINNKFCFLHIPKTGGNWVRTVLRESGIKQIKSNEISKHATYDLLVTQKTKSIFSRYSNREINYFCVVRHPLLWYQSWFNYQHTRGWKNWGEGGNLNPRKWHCLSPLNMPPQKDFNEFLTLVNRNTPGFLTHLYYSYTLPSNARVLKNENLREDVFQLNRQWRLGIDEELILNTKTINASKKSNIFWTEKNLVDTIENERSLFKKYDYSELGEDVVNIK